MSIEYNFAGIATDADDIMGAVGRTEGLLQDGKAAVTRLAAVWGGTASEAYQSVQNRWDNSSQELNMALRSLSNAIRTGGDDMYMTNEGNRGKFV